MFAALKIINLKIHILEIKYQSTISKFSAQDLKIVAILFLLYYIRNIYQKFNNLSSLNYIL